MKRIFFFLMLIISGSVFAQTGKIIGTVRDEFGKPLSGANVMLQKTKHGQVTDANGSFVIKNLTSGMYNIKLSHVGFETYQSEVVLKENQTLELEIKMKASYENLQEVHLTGTGLAEPIKNIAGSVSVIDTKVMQEAGAQNIGEIIQRASGVNFRVTEAGRGLKPEIGIRGLTPSKSGILTLVDGKFPTGMTLYSDTSSYYFMPLQQVDRVEIIKGGAAGVLYGGYSVGGVINLISKKATLQPTTKISLNYGSWNSLIAQITTGQDNGKFSYYVNANRRQGDSFQENGKFFTNDLTVKLGMKPDDDSKLEVYINAFSEDSQTPGGISIKQFNEDHIHKSNLPNDHFYSKRFSSSVTYSNNFGSRNIFNVSVYGNYFERNWFIAMQDPVRKGYTRDIHNVGLISDYKLSEDIFGKKNSLIIGTRIHTDRLNDSRIKQKEGDFSSQVGSTFSNIIDTSLVYEFYIYDEFNFTEKWVFSPGARFTSIDYRRRNMDLNPEKVEDASLNVNALVYNAGLMYKMDNHTNFYANISSGFRPPTRKSVLSPANIDEGTNFLKEETSTNYEIGVKTEPVDWVSVNLTGYLMQYQNKLVKDKDGFLRNTGSSLHRGVEAELQLGAWKGFSMFSNITLQRSTFESGEYKGNQITYSPQFMLSSGVRHKLLLGENALISNVFFSYTDKQYNDENNTEIVSKNGTIGPIPAYKVVDASVAYVAKNWDVRLSLHNLLNEKYFNRRGGWWGKVFPIFPAPPTNFRLGVSYKF